MKQTKYFPTAKECLFYCFNILIEFVDIVDYGDIKLGEPTQLPNPPNMHNYHEVVNTMRNLSDKVFQVLSDGRLCVTLGGDHSLAIGSLDGHLRHDPKAVVFWIDAHADLNTNLTSGSGSMHGMPVALCAKEMRQFWPQCMPGLDWLIPK